mgnify:FL=1
MNRNLLKIIRLYSYRIHQDIHLNSLRSKWLQQESMIFFCLYLVEDREILAGPSSDGRFSYYEPSSSVRADRCILNS